MFRLNHLAPELSQVVSVTKVVKYIMKWPFWVSHIFVFRQTDRSSRGQRSSRSCVNFAPDFIRLILTGWRQSGNFGSLYFDQGKWNDTQFDLKTLRSEFDLMSQVKSGQRDLWCIYVKFWMRPNSCLLVPLSSVCYWSYYSRLINNSFPPGL